MSCSVTENVDTPQEILRAVLQYSPDMIVLSAFSGTVLHINAAGRALIGLGDGEPAADLTTAELFTDAGLRRAAEVEAALGSRGQWSGPGELRHVRTGEAIAVMITTFVVYRGGDDSSVVIASIARDHRDTDTRERLQRAATDAAAQYGAEQKAIADLAQLALDGAEQDVMNAAVIAASTLIGVERAVITCAPDAVDDSDREESGGSGSVMTVVAATGLGELPTPLPAGAGSLMGFSAFTGEVVVCTDRDGENRFDTAAMTAHGIAVPITGCTDRPWGALSVHSAAPRQYGEREVSFLRSIAGVLSSALRRHHLDRQLRTQSLHDDLTGLPNRTLAYERIDAALTRSRVSSKHVAVLLLDIDDFKIINDSLGHEAGDRSLMQFARRLTFAVRPQDFVARLGGDEFLIVCEQVHSAEHARELAREISDAITTGAADTGFLAPLSASIGIALSDPDSTRREMIHRADLAMYRAKSTGIGGSHAVFDRNDVYDAQRIRTLSVDLRAALHRGELTMHYQPLIDLRTDRIVAVEALARWNHPVLGPIGPTEFVAVAEQTGLAEELGTWALTTAVRHAAAWRTFTDVGVRVNVSALQLRDPGFPARVAAILRSASLPASALGLEITETVWVADTARVADTLAALHESGVALLLDDMGRGHTSISYLNRYPVFACFKIDKLHITALPGPRPQAIVAAIVGVGRAYGVTVVGEGVETADQLAAVRAAGCDLAQGNHLARPMDLDSVTALLRAAVPAAVQTDT